MGVETPKWLKSWIHFVEETGPMYLEGSMKDVAEATLKRMKRDGSSLPPPGKMSHEVHTPPHKGVKHHKETGDDSWSI